MAIDLLIRGIGNYRPLDITRNRDVLQCVMAVNRPHPGRNRTAGSTAQDRFSRKTLRSQG
jgi:hypothetical protein